MANEESQSNGEPDRDDGSHELADLLSSLSSLRDVEGASSSLDDAAETSSTGFLDFESLPNDWGDDFVLLEKLASGMTGAYLAEQPQLSGHLYVIKILSDTKPESVKRFETEAFILGRLHKAGITNVPFPVFFGWHEGFPYLVMEHIAGKTIRQLMATSDWQPSLEEICQLMLDASNTLAAAHRFGVVHRDIKPSNLILGGDGRVRVIDFGVAKDEENKTSVTSTGLAPGTQAYMSPEQLAGKEATNRSDIFSLGLVFQELLERLKGYSSSRTCMPAQQLAARMSDRNASMRISSLEEVSRQLRSMANSRARFRKNRAVMLGLLVSLLCAAVIWQTAKRVGTTNSSADQSQSLENENLTAPAKSTHSREFVPAAPEPFFEPPPPEEERWRRMEPRDRR